jgi:hypothetical protein
MQISGTTLYFYTALVLAFGYIVIVAFSAMAFRAGRALGRVEATKQKLREERRAA